MNVFKAVMITYAVQLIIGGCPVGHVAFLFVCMLTPHSQKNKNSFGLVNLNEFNSCNKSTF